MAKFTQSPILSTQFSKALVFASEAHILQVRKGKIEVPYISHLLAVSSLVLESGGNEDEAIAALFHDLIEDIEINPLLISQNFGSRVTLIVHELSEDKTLPKKQRKDIYIQSILTMSESGIRVSIADKLHNIRCYSLSSELWGREQYDFYDGLLNNYQQRLFCLGVEAQWKEMDRLFEQLS